MWALTVPSPNGTSVMIWFIRTTWAGGVPLPANSSRIFLASVIHSSVRNLYGTDTPLLVRNGRTLAAAAGGDRSCRTGTASFLLLRGECNCVVGGQRPDHEPADERGELGDG